MTVEITFAAAAQVLDHLMVLGTLNILGMINVRAATSAVFLFRYLLNMVTVCLEQLSLLLNHSKERKNVAYRPSHDIYWLDIPEHV